ncbi:hypothetical protein ADL00_08105 [Streptomyces sp. AS58]|uniref:Uncharacterized protein n=1 Tax=Streptomyces cadmiisoli TaxID=2184053 RepID=A0A2Z4IXR7_9ACTN|nr:MULTISPECIES: hypothetical protein [Streptomyces]AWW37672.1 hypothetical protein DN051_14260 [Streptomyces cadmiisoli]KOV71496.1 hypothetical protein ADL00_08105 [Streptomyces sp. AS58]
MNTNQIEALIGMLAVVALFAIMILPAAVGVVRDRRIDRQLRQSERRRRTAGERSYRSDGGVRTRTYRLHTTR